MLLRRSITAYSACGLGSARIVPLGGPRFNFSTFHKEMSELFYHQSANFVSSKAKPVRPPRSTWSKGAVSAADSPSLPGKANIKVIGVGGGGNNALNRMLASGLQGVEIWVVNTDIQILQKLPVQNKLQIGVKQRSGVGCGGDPVLGRGAAVESEALIRDMLEGADLVFIAVGLGGGTGTGASPVIANIAKSMGILTLAIVTTPFEFEGKHRAEQASQGMRELRQVADSMIVIPNERLLQVAEPGVGLQNAFSMADDILYQGVQGISDIIVNPALVNVDFADVKAIMANSGAAMLGIGTASGAGRAERAAFGAFSNPLIQKSIEKAKGIVYSVSGGPDLGLQEINFVSQVLTSMADPSCRIIFGAVVDEAYEGSLHISIIATGFTRDAEEEIFALDGAPLESLPSSPLTP